MPKSNGVKNERVMLMMRTETRMESEQRNRRYLIGAPPPTCDGALASRSVASAAAAVAVDDAPEASLVGTD